MGYWDYVKCLLLIFVSLNRSDKEMATLFFSPSETKYLVCNCSHLLPQHLSFSSLYSFNSADVRYSPQAGGLNRADRQELNRFWMQTQLPIQVDRYCKSCSAHGRACRLQTAFPILCPSPRATSAETAFSSPLFLCKPQRCFVDTAGTNHYSLSIQILEIF